MMKLKALAMVSVFSFAAALPTLALGQESTAAKPPAAAAPTPYVTVNGYAISRNTVDSFISEQQAQGVQDSPQFQQAVREEMIRRGALLSEAKKQGLDKKADYKRQIEVASQAILMRNVVLDYLSKNPVSDGELQTAYNAVVANVGNNEYKLRHIQLKQESEAKELIAKLVDGKKFEKLAKESVDPETKDKGGDLGWKSPYTLPVPVRDAVKNLEKGQFTKVPVQIQSNYHVFLMEDTRPFTPPGLNELRPSLTQGIVQVKVAKYIENLRAQAQVK